MDATHLLIRIARALRECKLEVIMVGNAGAAMQGAPVTTVDFDFMFRKTPSNIRKLKQFASLLDATVFRPYYPISDLFRVCNDAEGIQVDFMATLHGLRSFEAVRSRATLCTVGNYSLYVASLEDIIRSKRAANRPQDRAVLPTLEATQRERKHNGHGKK